MLFGLLLLDILLTKNSFLDRTLGVITQMYSTPYGPVISL